MFVFLCWLGWVSFLICFFFDLAGLGVVSCCLILFLAGLSVVLCDSLGVLFCFCVGCGVLFVVCFLDVYFLGWGGVLGFLLLLGGW